MGKLGTNKNWYGFNVYANVGKMQFLSQKGDLLLKNDTYIEWLNPPK